MIAFAPSNRAFITRTRHLHPSHPQRIAPRGRLSGRNGGAREHHSSVGSACLAFNAKIHDVIPTNGTIIHLDIPGPQSYGLPLDTQRIVG
jgi:hypothetical protein